ncbi:MAG: OprO/OprP family phosphate-selective porin [Pirellulales bacterium]
MRDGTWRGLVGISATLVMWAGLNTAWAQDPSGYYGGPYASEAAPAPETPSAAPVVSDAAFAGAQVAPDAMSARLSALETKLKEMTDKEAEAKKKAAGKPTVEVFGRAYADWNWFDQSPNNEATFGDIQNGFQFRAARIGVKGEAFEIMDYEIEMDFAGRDSGNLQRTLFKNVYMGVKDLPLLGNVRVGHFKEPFSLEELTSSRFITFMERASINEAFVPGRNAGVMAFDWTENERATWAIGAFRTMQDNPPYIQVDDGDTAVTGRVTWLPWYDEATEGRGLWHLGAAYSFRALAHDLAQYRSRPEDNLAPRFVDTGVFAGENMQLFGAETAWVYGPFSVQSEYMAAFTDRAGVQDLAYNGAYVEVSYFLTGEHRVYKKTTGAFDRVKPFENFFRVRTTDGSLATGKGAWQVAGRYSFLDLNDDGVLGGRLSDYTLGLNWYLTPYSRLMWNYVVANVDNPVHGDSSANIFEMRAQFDF